MTKGCDEVHWTWFRPPPDERCDMGVLSLTSQGLAVVPDDDHYSGFLQPVDACVMARAILKRWSNGPAMLLLTPTERAEVAEVLKGYRETSSEERAGVVRRLRAIYEALEGEPEP